MPRSVKKLPVSGSEPTCTKAPYGTKRGTISANCFQYAIQHASMVPYRKLQPGNLSGNEGVNFNLSTCHPAKKRVMEDLVATKRGYETTMDTPCAKGFAKIVLMLSKNNDFHFARQNGDIVYLVEPGETRASIAKKFRVPMAKVLVPKTPLRPGAKVRILDANVWSHKRGTAYPPTLYDAKGKIIFDPRKSNFDYGDLNYDRICSAFCIKQKPCGKAKIKSPQRVQHAINKSPDRGGRMRRLRA